MTILWSNNASTSISGSITATDTSVALAAGTGIEFPIPGTGDYYIATFYDQATKTRNEIVHVTAMAGDVATIVRGQEGTTPQAWNAGDIFANLVTAGTLRAFVQAGTGPVSTQSVYVGTDTSNTPNLIIANTIPTFGSYAIGMLINILVKNGNSGATNVQLNGLPSVALTRNNGAALVGGDITASEEVTMVYNGTNLNTGLPDIRHAPPVTTFYIRPGGNDNNTGWYNDDADAFATIYGAINQIKNRYSSQNVLTLRVADGYYTGGFGDSNSYIAGWNIIGNTASPTNVVVDATSTSPPAGANGDGTGFKTNGPSYFQLSGLAFKSYGPNVMGNAGSVVILSNNHYSTPVSGGLCIWAYSGSYVFLRDTHTFDTQGVVPSALMASAGALLQVAQNGGAFPSMPATINIVGNPTVGATLIVEANGHIDLQPGVITWTGGIPQGPKYIVNTGGGLDTHGNTGQIPGSAAGSVTSPGWVA